VPRVAIFGEPLIELSLLPCRTIGDARVGIAGDTLNTAVYLARLGVEVDYVTARGTDPYSEAILAFLHSEGVGTSGILRHPERVPGLYAIGTDAQGERSFTYWRSASAARQYFTLSCADEALTGATGSGTFYFSGISLSILDETGRERLMARARAASADGVRVVFDGNFRARGWQSANEARMLFERVATFASILLPTDADDDALFGKRVPARHAKYWSALGASLVVEKCGPEGALVVSNHGEPFVIPVPVHLKPIDTTGAGDSFNAAFLAAILSGQSIESAVRAGHALAGVVICRRGAIIPAADMPSGLVTFDASKP
jgi:2-dehydro-3-deoxygluconokinase